MSIFITNQLIKILHIGQALGGVDTYIRSIIDNLDPAAFQCILVHGSDESEKGFLDKDGQPCQEFSLPIERDPSLFKDFFSVIKLWRIIRQIKPDIIHCHSSKGGLIGRLAGLFSQIPVLYTPNAFSYLSSNSTSKRRFYLSYERIFSRMSNGFLLACSDSERKRGVNEVGFPSNRAMVWSNSILPSNDIKVSTEPFLLTIGRPSYQKNLEMLVEVMKILKSKKVAIRLKVLGVGHYSPQKEKVVELIREQELEDHIELLEWVPRQEALETMSKCTAYVSASRYEGLPYSVLEAMSMGKPVVCTNVDGNRDAVEDHSTGFIVDLDDVNSFADKVLRLLDDETFYIDCAQNAKKRFEVSFDLRKNIVRLQEIYASLAKAKSKLKH